VTAGGEVILWSIKNDISHLPKILNSALYCHFRNLVLPASSHIYLCKVDHVKIRVDLSHDGENGKGS